MTMRWHSTAAALLGLGTLAWLAFWAQQALGLWRRDQVCVLVAGPFLPCGPGPQAWQPPLIVALLPAALLGVMWALRSVVRGLRG